jgi:DNA-binding FadR family transcriptional regulator
MIERPKEMARVAEFAIRGGSGNGAPIARAATVIADQLRGRIIRGEVQEGEALPSEQQLLSDFGVSRPTLREAIRVLESESLVVVKRGSRGGIEVSVPSIETAAHYTGLLLEYQRATLGDVFLAAAAIEGPCAAILAATRSDEALGALHDHIAAERAGGDAHAVLLQRQNDFHRLIIELAGSATMRALSEVLRHIIEVATENFRETSPDEWLQSHQVGARTHAKLVRLIESRDADGAESLWHRHISETGKRLRAAGIAESVLDFLE